MVTQAERMTKIETDIGYIKETLCEIKEHISTSDEKYAKKSVEPRVSKLEANVYKIMGGIVLFNALVTFIILYYRP